MDPIKDYDTYINGKWKKKHRIPDDRGRWSTFDILSEKIDKQLCQLCQADTDDLAAFYNRALEPIRTITIKNLLMRIIPIETLEDFLRLSWEYYQIDVQTFFGLGLSVEKGVNLPYIYQSGLGLPDKSNYTDKTIVPDYLDFIGRFGRAYGFAFDVQGIFDFEQRLAVLHMDNTTARNVNITHNRLAAKDLPDFFSLFQLDLKDVIVDNVALLRALPELLKTTPLAVLKDYLRYKVASDYATFQPKAIRQIKFDFFSKRLLGRIHPPARKMRALQMVENFFPEKLEQLYLRKGCPDLAHARTACTKMVKQITAVLKTSIENAPWITGQTEKRSLEKLNRLTVEIGYPKRWRSTEGLDIAPGSDLSFAEMHMKRAKWFYQQYVRKQFYRVVDMAIWDMAVYDVNAYYDLNLNMVVVPAGILQKPFFNYTEVSRNFGGLGCIIGHELTHGFDDQGRKYNPQHEMKQWWTPRDIRAYEHRAAKVRKYYSEMKFMGHPLNGALTLGENIADIGGLKLSLGALKLLPGRPDYRSFFKAYAILWRELIRPKAVRQSLLENPHSPDGIRINAVLAHIAEFHQTYGHPLSLKAIEQLNEYSIW